TQSVTGASCGPVGTTSCAATWSNGNPTCAVLEGTTGAAGIGTQGAPPLITNGTTWNASRAAGGAVTPALTADVPATPVTSTTFVVGAAGRIDATGTAIDSWTINDGKVVTQTAIGY
ncbi:MAG: hypothetical protein HY074_13520, partial [Deltaproteobacteria bacterium]|nr:hypothetical protein [Deltaproteobacteria bacterium]